VTEYLAQHLVDNASTDPPASAAASGPAGDRLTWAELDRLSTRVAGCLAANGVRRGDRVALCLRRTPRAVVAIIGTLRADGVYVPIDPKSPIERQRQVICDSRPSAVICDRQTAAIALGLAHRCGIEIPTVCLDDAPTAVEPGSARFLCRADVEAFPDRRPAYRSIDTDIAYILYTSGSTGRPKGVMVTHRNVLDYARWSVEFFGMSKEDKVLATAPFHFDMSTFDIFAALKSRARLCIAPEDLLLFPHRLLGYLEEEGATIWKTVPSLFVYMDRTGCLKARRMPTLSRLLFGGEVLHPGHLARWMRLYPEKAFYNAYGPTEATGVSLCHRVTAVPEDGATRVPIGRPCANTEAFVLRADGTLAGAGEEGELYIRGAGVAAGYWDDPEKTRAAFVDNPLSPGRGERVYRTGDRARGLEHGTFEFLGRNDEQVKYMGYRIATSDIEAALLSMAGVNEAAVFLDDSEDLVVPELVALVQVGPERQAAEIGKELALRLPAYMIPKRIILVSRLPRTDRGKIARQELRALASGRSS
jgi:D-alanine--poly(phosphoribitol) ligase subunit 1